MRHTFLLLAAITCSISSMAQMYLWQGGYSTPAQLDSITFSSNAEFDKTFIVQPSMTSIQAGTTMSLELTKNTLSSKGAYQWISSNEGVATVDTNGTITALGTGMAIIYATSGQRTQTCILTVYDFDSIYFANQTTELQLYIGASKQISINWEPAGYPAPLLTWTSSNEDVATVSQEGIVVAKSEGTATITAKHNNTTLTCTITVVEHETLKNYAIGGWGLFGTPEYIEGTEKYVTFTSGDSAKCKLGYISLYVWDNNLTYVSGSGFSGTGYICFADLPVWWIIEGDNAGYYVGSSNGFFIDTITTGYTYEPYVAERGELVDVNKYGEFFSQYVAHLSDTTVNVDSKLYSESMTGAHLCILYADDNFTQSWYLGNMKYANLLTTTDSETGATNYNYKATIEWFDFLNDDHYFGLKANYDENNNIQSIVTPYDMRTMEKEYTNMQGSQAPKKAVGYVIGDKSRVHSEMPVIHENSLMRPMDLRKK